VKLHLQQNYIQVMITESEIVVPTKHKLSRDSPYGQSDNITSIKLGGTAKQTRPDKK
jgi:hypothetical protein